MSSPHPNHIANKYGMLECCISSHETQKDADKQVKALSETDEILAEYAIFQFASGKYYVVVVPRIIA